LRRSSSGMAQLGVSAQAWCLHRYRPGPHCLRMLAASGEGRQPSSTYICLPPNRVSLLIVYTCQGSPLVYRDEQMTSSGQMLSSIRMFSCGHMFTCEYMYITHNPPGLGLFPPRGGNWCTERRNHPRPATHSPYSKRHRYHPPAAQLLCQAYLLVLAPLLCLTAQAYCPPALPCLTA
jgi:hypothetical protein